MMVAGCCDRSRRMVRAESQDVVTQVAEEYSSVYGPVGVGVAHSLHAEPRLRLGGEPFEPLACHIVGQSEVVYQAFAGKVAALFQVNVQALQKLLVGVMD